MSVLTTRGGVPRVQIEAIDATGRRYVPGGAYTDPSIGRYSFDTEYLQILNATGGNELRIYFLEADFTADENYIALAAGTSWEGPAEVKEFWLRSAAGTTATIVAFQRRG